MPCLLCGAFIAWPLKGRTALNKPGSENTGGQVHPNEREELQFYVAPKPTGEQEGLCNYACMLSP